jgi:hypothetical protein
VSDSVLNVNQTGRDGELWDGDGVGLMVDRNATWPVVQNSIGYHLLVDVDNALTDGRGDGSGWDRSWTAGAVTAVSRISGGCTVGVGSMGGTPSVGAALAWTWPTTNRAPPVRSRRTTGPT